MFQAPQLPHRHNQLPEEYKDILLSTWRDVWYDQLRQQVNQTMVEQPGDETASQSTSQDYAAAVRFSRFLTRSIPAYNAGEEQGIDNWLARFKYEYSWELNFAFLPSKHPDRLHFTDMRSVEELLRDMSLDHQEAAEVTNRIP